MARPRAFEQTPTRESLVLDRRWQFFPADDHAFEPGEAVPTSSDRIPVPCAWNALPEYYDHMGPAWYVTDIDLEEPGPVLLRFLGVKDEATVYWDGEEVTSHYGGYTGFSVLLEDCSSGSHQLAVRADNERGDRTLPLPGADWFPYGGITREVVLERPPTLFIDEVRVGYELDGETAHLEITAAIRNLGTRQTETLSVSIGEFEIERTIDFEADATTVALEESLTGIERWDLDDPTLYTLDATLGDDHYRERIGFRTIETSEKALLLNGEAVDIRGVNRHEDYPDFGAAQPPRIQEGDLRLLERAGLNTIRTSHYPNHPRLLDYCDERGILVIEEIPYWQYGEDDFGREPVLERGKAMLREMIRRDRHHPSIFAWSVTNECSNHEPGVEPATKELIQVVRRTDSTRPVTLASNKWHGGYDDPDPCLDHVDFACINGYPGWYGGGDWTSLLEVLDDRYQGMPVMVSEFGGGAIAGERTFDNQKWSESYQTALLERYIETFEAHDRLCGWTIWQYCDTRTDPEKAMGRPRTKNNKGILTEYRRPKESYQAIERRFGNDN